MSIFFLGVIKMAIIDAEQQRVNDLYRMIRTYGFKISKDDGLKG